MSQTAERKEIEVMPKVAEVPAFPQPERAVLARREEALVPPGEERSLAEVVARPAASGLAGDTVVTITLRFEDLPSVIEASPR